MSVKAVGRAVVPGLTALGINAVPAYGVFVAGWSPATTMLVYLVENLVLVLSTSIRMHWLLPSGEALPGRPAQTRATLIKDFLVVALAFSAGAAVFLGAMIFLFLKLPVEPAAITSGVYSIAAVQAAGIVVDRLWGGRRPLAAGEAWVNQSLGRVFLLFLAVFVGVFAASLSNDWFVVPFIALKTIVDLGSHAQAVVNVFRTRPVA